jgi:hypothetical protein
MTAAAQQHFDPTMESRAAAVESAAPPATAYPGPRGVHVHTAGAGAFSPRVKSPLVASFLSLVPGLGQIYVGYYSIGFLHALIVASMITLIAADVLDDATPLLGLFIPFFWLYNIIDAGRRAALYNLAIEGGGDLPLPGRLPALGSSGGPLPVGVVLVVIGAIFLSNTAFGLSLRWLEDWWPLAPILFGTFLILKGLADRGRNA